MNASASLQPVRNPLSPEMANLMNSLNYILTDTAHLRELSGEERLTAATRVKCIGFWLGMLEADLATMELDIKRLESYQPRREPVLLLPAEGQRPVEELAA